MNHGNCQQTRSIQRSGSEIAVALFMWRFLLLALARAQDAGAMRDDVIFFMCR